MRFALPHQAVIVAAGIPGGAWCAIDRQHFHHHSDATQWHSLDNVFDQNCSARNGCTPYVWTMSGPLPPGLISTVNAQSLSLSGTPTAAKGCGGRTATASYTVSIGLAPAHVVNLSCTDSTSNDVAGYNMYRGTDGVNWQRDISVGLISWTTYSDSSDANHTAYYYSATAVDIYGAESVLSSPGQVSVP